MNITYDEQQQNIIDLAVASAVDRIGFEYDHDGELREHSVIGEWFAVFGGTAFKLMHGVVMNDEYNTIYEYIPVIVNKHAIAEYEDERPGVLHLIRCIKNSRGYEINPKWSDGYMNFGQLNSYDYEIFTHR